MPMVLEMMHSQTFSGATDDNGSGGRSSRTAKKISIIVCLCHWRSWKRVLFTAFIYLFITILYLFVPLFWFLLLLDTIVPVYWSLKPPDWRLSPLSLMMESDHQSFFGGSIDLIEQRRFKSILFSEVCRQLLLLCRSKFLKEGTASS